MKQTGQKISFSKIFVKFSWNAYRFTLNYDNKNTWKQPLAKWQTAFKVGGGDDKKCVKTDFSRQCYDNLNYVKGCRSHFLTGCVRVLENLESPGILFWQRAVRRINIEILGVYGLMWILEPLKNQEIWLLEKPGKFVSKKGYEPYFDLMQGWLGGNQLPF